MGFKLSSIPGSEYDRLGLGAGICAVIQVGKIPDGACGCLGVPFH